MAKNNLKKRKLSQQPNSTNTKKKPDNDKEKLKATTSGSDSEDIEQLLQPLSKDQVITLLTNLALSNPFLSSRIRSLADSDISHRKIFVHGLPFDTTDKTLLSAFKPFGEIQDFNLVKDRVSGRAKGYAFITYTTRKGAEKALENPNKKVSNRVVSCQLASVGPSSPAVLGDRDVSGRKIYVSNVPVDVNVEKMRDFFAKFGEIESGPLGFDVETGKCKGYALFVYKSVEGARKALEEPCKVFEGRQLSCQKAAQGKSGGGAAGITTTVMSVPMPMSLPLQQQQQPMLAAAGLQNMALLGQTSNAAAAMGLLNVTSLYGGLIGNPSIGGLVNMDALNLGQVGAGGVGMVEYGPYGGVLGTHGLGSLGGFSASPSVLGAYGVGSAGGVGLSPPVVQGLQQAYPVKQNGKTSSPAKAPTTSGRSSYK